MKHHDEKTILAIVGMPGAGKTQLASYLAEKGLPFVRFGDETDRALKEKGLPLTEEHEREYRERIRHELGMATYAITAKPKIVEALRKSHAIIVDGLYSWEEYIFLKKEFPKLALICVFAEPPIRYVRLQKRPIRPLSQGQTRQRDIDEIEKLSKGGPIAIADYFIENNGTLKELKEKTDALLKRIGIA